MASIHNNPNVGTNPVHGAHHGKSQHVARQDENHGIQEPTDSTASFTALPTKSEKAKDTEASSTSITAKSNNFEVDGSPVTVRASFTNSPVTMLGEAQSAQGIDLNGPDRLHEATIDAPHGIHSTKLVGLSGNTLGDLSPYYPLREFKLPGQGLYPRPSSWQEP